MRKSATTILTIIAFLLVPVIAFLRLTCPAQPLAYGNQEVTLGSVLLLVFGIFCFLISTFNLLHAHKSWKAAEPDWKTETISAYLYTILFALSLAFLMMFTDYRGYDYGSTLLRHGVVPGAFVLGLIFVSPAFLFPIGLVLLVLALAGLKYRNTRPKSYLIAAFVAAIVSTLGGAIPAFWVGTFWLSGGLALCYCPVNRKTSVKNFLLRPVYSYRRRRLRKELNI
ncbi:MAG: hypothetical protein ACYSTF_03365 [Planctomycetota bacterium]|jgi:hypothetical protein